MCMAYDFRIPWGSLGWIFTVFQDLLYMFLIPPKSEVPTPGHPSKPESDPNLGQYTLCHGTADRLCPNCLNRSIYHSCAVVFAVPAKLPEELGVQLLLKVLHLEWNPQASFSLSPQARASDPTTDCLPSSPWRQHSVSCRLLGGLSYPSFRLSGLGYFWSGPTGLPFTWKINL